jgi:hypothetical protein
VAFPGVVAGRLCLAHLGAPVGFLDNAVDLTDLWQNPD